MYAVVKTGGKQYRVEPGNILEVERLEGDVGSTITLDEVLMVANGDSITVGQPMVEGASVEATITGQHRDRKIQKRIRVRKGHRQYKTRLEIGSISL